MSQLSPEVIISDFNKLKEMFNKQEEVFIWDSFAKYNFNFNKTLEFLLETNQDNQDLDKDQQQEDNQDLEKDQGYDYQTKSKFNVMETLSNLFTSQNQDTSNDYQRLE